MNYYILSLKWTRDRNRQIVWWGPGNSGYTEDLAAAGVYTEEQVRDQPDYYNNRESTIAVPVEEAAKLAYRSVSTADVEALIGQPVWTTKEGLRLRAMPPPEEWEEEHD